MSVIEILDQAEFNAMTNMEIEIDKRTRIRPLYKIFGYNNILEGRMKKTMST